MDFYDINEIDEHQQYPHNPYAEYPPREAPISIDWPSVAITGLCLLIVYTFKRPQTVLFAIIWSYLKLKNGYMKITGQTHTNYDVETFRVFMSDGRELDEPELEQYNLKSHFPWTKMLELQEEETIDHINFAYLEYWFNEKLYAFIVTDPATRLHKTNETADHTILMASINNEDVTDTFRKLFQSPLRTVPSNDLTVAQIALITDQVHTENYELKVMTNTLTQFSFSERDTILLQ